MALSGSQFRFYSKKVESESPGCALKPRVFSVQGICIGVARLCVLKAAPGSLVRGTTASMQIGAVPRTMRQPRSQWLLSPSALRDMQTSSENIDCPIDSGDWRERPVGLHQDTFFTLDVLIKAY